MPSYILAIIKVLITYAGPVMLRYVKAYLENAYPDYAKYIEKLISDLLNPSKSNSASRKKAKECIGVACEAELKG